MNRANFGLSWFGLLRARRVWDPCFPWARQIASICFLRQGSSRRCPSGGELGSLGPRTSAGSFAFAPMPGWGGSRRGSRLQRDSPVRALTRSRQPSPRTSNRPTTTRSRSSGRDFVHHPAGPAEWCTLFVQESSWACRPEPPLCGVVAVALWCAVAAACGGDKSESSSECAVGGLGCPCTAEHLCLGREWLRRQHERRHWRVEWVLRQRGRQPGRDWGTGRGQPRRAIRVRRVGWCRGLGDGWGCWILGGRCGYVCSRRSQRVGR